MHKAESVRLSARMPSHDPFQIPISLPFDAMHLPPAAKSAMLYPAVVAKNRS